MDLINQLGMYEYCFNSLKNNSRLKSLNGIDSRLDIIIEQISKYKIKRSAMFKIGTRENFNELSSIDEKVIRNGQELFEGYSNSNPAIAEALNKASITYAVIINIKKCAKIN